MQVRTRTWLSFVVAASVLFIIASRFAIFDPLEDATLSVAAPIESGLRDATQPFADFISHLTDINRLSDDNQSLKEENERLLAELARLHEVEIRNQELEQLLNLRGQRAGEALLASSVFAREPNNLQDLVAIDRGASDGVAEGMVVLTQQGSLVGSVTRVLDHSAWVTLITDQTSAVSAVIQASRVQGVVAGSTDGNLTMEFVEGTADVNAGDLVLTSGIGGSYPPGEVIGKVTNVERTAQELFQSVRVEPLAALERLEGVLVLTSFVPQQGAAP
jgi:rod shape-determining protein MreC